MQATNVELQELRERCEKLEQSTTSLANQCSLWRDRALKAENEVFEIKKSVEIIERQDEIIKKANEQNTLLVERANELINQHEDDLATIAGLDATWQTIDKADKYKSIYRLFSTVLINEDFNPTGTVEGFWQDGEGWIGAVWNGYTDQWDYTIIQPTHYQKLTRPIL